MTAEDVWEECICDFLGDINIFSKSANGSLVVNELINQTQAIVKEQKAEPNQTRGSPDAEGKASRDMNAENTFSEVFSKKILDSFGITNVKDSIHVQRRVLQTLENENFFDNAEKRSRTVINQMSGMNIEINKSGIDETFSFNNFVRLGKFKKIAKLATIRELPNVIKYGHIIANDVANQYDSADKNKTFAYIQHTTEVDGNQIIVRLAIKKSPQKNKFWVHSIYTIKNVSDSPASTNKGTEAGHITADSRYIISQKTDLSTQNSKNVLEGKASRELDTKYLSAVERGDMETAQKMVDEAAKKAGYNINAYHGTRENFNEFLGGAFFTDDYFNADGYAAGERVIDAYLKIQNPLVIDAEGRKWDDLSSQYGSSTREIVGRVGRLVDKINSLKYDGIIFENINDNWIDDVDFESTETVYYIFDSKQAKSADPVTYDDDGNVIPLSERFNSESNDIRYSRELDALDYITPEEELEAVETQAFSNRTLLANALLDTITSSEEYKLIRSYQEEIAQLDKSDKRLAQLKKDRNQLYKQEKPNFEVIRELKEKDYTICAKYTKKTLKKQGKTLKNHLVKLYRFML